MDNRSILPWAILIFAALSVIFLGGKRRAFGTFVAQLHKDFSDIQLTELDWIGDSYSAFGHLTTSLSCTMILYFNRRYGLFQFIGATFVLISCISSAYVPSPHWMFLTVTVLHGIGSSLILSTAGLVVNEYFDKKHKYHILATTMVSGGSIASIFFILLFAFLIQTYNWRNAFLILGVLYFIVLTLAAFPFRKNDQLTQAAVAKGTKCNLSVITRPQIPLLVLWFIDRFMTSVVTYGVLMNLTDFSYNSNKDLLGSSVLTTIFAGGEGSTYLIGAIITGLTKDFFKNKIRYILLCSSLLMSASLILLAFASNHVNASYALCFFAGFGLGPSNTFTFPGGEELTKLPGHLAYPFSLVGIGLGMLISPMLSGMIAEHFSYKWFFVVQGILIFIKVICITSIILLLFYYEKRGFVLEFPTLLAPSINVPPEEDYDDQHTSILSQDFMKSY